MKIVSTATSSTVGDFGFRNVSIEWNWMFFSSCLAYANGHSFENRSTMLFGSKNRKRDRSISFCVILPDSNQRV